MDQYCTFADMPVGCYFFFLRGKPGMYEKVSETSAERRNHSEKKLRENLRDERVMVHPASMPDKTSEPNLTEKEFGFDPFRTT